MSKHITRRKRADGSYYPEWTFACMIRGKRIKRTLLATTEAEARKEAARLYKGLLSDQAAEYYQLLEAIKQRRTGASIGDIARRGLDLSEQVRKTAADQRRMVNQLYNVVAIANDLWRVHEGGIQGVRIGAQVPDRERIDKLPATVLDGALVKRYFRAALGVETLNWMEVYEGAKGINSRLKQARDLFRGLSAREKMGDLDLPDFKANGFLTGLLKEADGLPEPIEREAFAAMVETFEALKETRRDLWLVNLVIRQTGMRSLSSAMQVRPEWIRKLDDGCWLHVEGKTRYTIPVTEELSQEILSKEGPLFGPEGAALLREHTAILKGVIGAGVGHQVNHRLRDTVASAVYHWLGLEAAREALGHTSSAVTLASYARRMDVSELMKRELRAWKRVAKF